MIELANKNLCTGCGACAFKCPKNCISMKEDRIGQVYPVIDHSSCIECHSCEKVCPILNKVDFYKANKAYAAWSNDPNERRTSASGGIAIEMYKLAIGEGYTAVGASQNKDFTVTHKVVTTLAEIFPFKNSKYVFSNTYDAFSKIKTALQNNNPVIFIGLPCQVAALRKIFFNNTNLLLVEIVCHGTTPFSYLKQHIDLISKQQKQVAATMSFRAPEALTHTFTFTLYDNSGKCFYAKRTKDGDTYQFGYHRAISYRENCYHCIFARPERNADITIADYHGLGLCADYSFNTKNVSLILENTRKGHEFIIQLIRKKRIHAEERPIEEPFKGEPQLRHPSIKNKYRIIFETNIKTNGGCFEEAISSPLQKYKRDMYFRSTILIPYRAIKRIYKAIKK